MSETFHKRRRSGGNLLEASRPREAGIGGTLEFAGAGGCPEGFRVCP